MTVDPEDSIEIANNNREGMRIILDSGATSHMFTEGCNYDYFVDKKTKIMYVNGRNYSISTGYGRIVIKSHLKLQLGILKVPFQLLLQEETSIL